MIANSDEVRVHDGTIDAQLRPATGHGRRGVAGGTRGPSDATTLENDRSADVIPVLATRWHVLPGGAPDEASLKVQRWIDDGGSFDRERSDAAASDRRRRINVELVPRPDRAEEYVRW